MENCTEGEKQNGCLSTEELCVLVVYPHDHVTERELWLLSIVNVVQHSPSVGKDPRLKFK